MPPHYLSTSPKTPTTTFNPPQPTTTTPSLSPLEISIKNQMISKQLNVTEKAMALFSLRFESGDEMGWVVCG